MAVLSTKKYLLNAFRAESLFLILFTIMYAKLSNMLSKEKLFYVALIPFLIFFVLIVLAYGVAINLVEVTWKGQLKLQYANPNDYNIFTGYFSTVTGAITIIMMLFVGGWCLMRGGIGCGLRGNNFEDAYLAICNREIIEYRT